MANNQLDVFIEKNTPLPARNRLPHRTVYPVQAGQAGDLINIPVVEGEKPRADRNRLVGCLKIPSDKVRRDLPAGTEVEIMIEIDESRMVTTEAYIPVLDEVFPAKFELGTTTHTMSELRENLEREKRRLSEAREKAASAGDPRAEEAMARIDQEQILQQVESLLAAAQSDPGTLAACEKRLLDLKAAVDELENALEWPVLVKEAEENLTETRRIVNEYGQADEKKRLPTLEKDLRRAIESGDPDLLRSRWDRLRSLATSVLMRQPWFWCNGSSISKEGST